MDEEVVVAMRYDPPNDYGCDPDNPRPLCYGDFAIIAVAAGLTVEELTQFSVSSGGIAAKNDTTIFGRLCFNPLVGVQAQRQMGPQWEAVARVFDVDLAGPACGSHWDPAKQAQNPQPDTVNFNVGP
jgi:hypothetical protein